MSEPLPTLSPQQAQQDRGVEINAGVAVVFVLATLAIIARLWARRMKHVEYGLDDWLIIAAWPFCLALSVLGFVIVKFGMGKHLRIVKATDPGGLVIVANISYAFQILWAISLPFIKISILALYNRVFGGINYIRYTNWTLAIFTICWSISTALVCAFQCIPVAVAWNPTSTGKCIDARAFQFAVTAIDLVVWFIMLLLPLPAVWALQKSRSDRVALMVVFILGGATCVISTIRLVEVALNQVGKGDTTYDGVQVAIWTVAQPCLGVVCACLPTMTPLLRACLPGKNKGYKRSRGPYFGDYGTAASTVHRRSQGEEPMRNIASRRRANLHALGFDDFGYGFRIERDVDNSNDLNALNAMHSQTDSSSNRNEVYALTTIEVEEHHKTKGSTPL